MVWICRDRDVGPCGSSVRRIMGAMGGSEGKEMDLCA